MLQYDFENSIGYWICAAAHDVARALNEELAAHGITFRQWEVLCHLSLLGDQSQTELAERMRIEAPTLVGVLDRMERDGWIQRVTDENDRRRKLIRPTQQVEPVWSRMIECAKRVRARAIGTLTPEELEFLRGMLASVRENLAADQDHPTPAAAAVVGDMLKNGD